MGSENHLYILHDDFVMIASPKVTLELKYIFNGSS